MDRDRSPLVRVERNCLGPRLFVAGVRVHEWHLGLALIAAALAVPGLRGSAPGIVAFAVGAWLFVKDWNDLFPSRRDTAAWSIRAHRAPTPLKPAGRFDWLPPLAGLLAAFVGVVNIASALTPGVSLITPFAPDRTHFLLTLLPATVPHAAQAFALPAGAALVVIARQLARRRRRAWVLAVAVLTTAGFLNLLKGLDVAEALACWGLAAALVASRSAFRVGPQAGAAAALRQAALVALASIAVLAATIVAAAHWATPATTWSRGLGEVVARATWSPGPLHYDGPFEWVPMGIDAMMVCALLGIAWIVFRPLAHTREFPAAAVRGLAAGIVSEHGHDTLSSFKLRPDKHYFFSSDRAAFVGYGVEGRRLVISGDPVGPPEAVRMLIRELCGFAEARGLKLAGVGASAAFADLTREAGLRSFYIGDEALVDTNEFSLEGRKIRKVRQAVAKVERAGYTAELVRAGDLAPEELAQLCRLAAEWRGDDIERGFSMATDRLDGEHLADSLVLVARVGGQPGGILHFVRCYGRSAVSLGLMRRDREAPNGLTEFMVVQAIDALKARGIEEISLNFAPFARLIHSPASASERVLGRVAVAADRFFQVERLYRFNAKFLPRWEPRYMIYEGLFGLPRAGLAVMWAERQLPKPSLARRAA